jgi:hypothetical protein
MNSHSGLRSVVCARNFFRPSPGVVFSARGPRFRIHTGIEPIETELFCTRDSGSFTIFRCGGRRLLLRLQRLGGKCVLLQQQQPVAYVTPRPLSAHVTRLTHSPSPHVCMRPPPPPRVALLQPSRSTSQRTPQRHNHHERDWYAGTQ